MRVNVCIHILRYRFYMYSASKKCVDHKSFMMHANTCCTCNHISTRDMLGSATVISSQEPIIQITSLMHHSSTLRPGMRSPNQYNTLCLKCQFIPPSFCQFIIRMGCTNHIYMLGNNGHTRCAYTPTWVDHVYLTIASMWLHACQHITCQYVHVLYNQHNR